MKTKEFNQLKKEIKNGNFKGLKKDVIQNLTLNQAKTLEDIMLDLELNEEGNKILDVLVAFIDNTAVEEKKVANKKVLLKKEEKEEKDTKKATEKTTKSQPKGNKENNILEKVQVGDIVKFRVEGEEIEHNIKIIYISRYDVIAISSNEREVFKIRKIDFQKQIFEWTDRKGETYNIIITI